MAVDAFGHGGREVHEVRAVRVDGTNGGAAIKRYFSTGVGTS